MKFKPHKIILFLALLEFSMTAFAENKMQRPQLTFSSAIEISPRKEISLYDLVEAKFITDEVLSQLTEVVVAENSTQTIKKTDLIKHLRLLDAQFLIPTEIKLIRSKQNISRMEIERKIKNQLLKNCNDCEFNIQVNTVPQGFDSNWKMDLNIDLNKSSVLIPIASNSNQQLKGWVSAEIKKYAQVPVLNRTTRVGDVITEDMVLLEKRLIKNYNEIIFDKKNIIGMQAARLLNPGQFLTFRDLKKETILKKGQMVKALFGKGAFEVSLSAIAEESGAIGDVIKLKNSDSNKMFAGKIIDRGVVIID